MAAMTERRWPLAVLLVALPGALTVGCAKNAPSTTSTVRMSEAQAGDPLAELRALEDEMRRQGLPVAESKPRPATGADGEAADGDDWADKGPAVTEESPAPDPGGTPPPEREIEFHAGETEQPEPPAEPQRDYEADAPADAAAAGGVHRDRQERYDPCVSVCDLSEAICDLEVRICTMAEDHGDEWTYVDACERAVEDCEVAGDACDHCIG